MLQAGARVAVPAYYFDTKGDNSWSFSQFGDNWASAKCKGTNISIVVSRKSARIKWDVDGKITTVQLSVLELISESNGKFSVFL